jgi:hypothetical protein
VSFVNGLVLVLSYSCPCVFSGSKSANVLAVLGGVAADALDLTGFYYSGKRFVPKRTQQRIPASTT